MPKFRVLTEVEYLSKTGEKKVAAPGTPSEIVDDFADITVQSGWLVNQGFVIQLPDDWEPQPQGETEEAEPAAPDEPLPPDEDTTSVEEEEKLLPPVDAEEDGDA